VRFLLRIGGGGESGDIGLPRLEARLGMDPPWGRTGFGGNGWVSGAGIDTGPEGVEDLVGGCCVLGFFLELGSASENVVPDTGVMGTDNAGMGG
jgi:hypothetical protein